MDIIQSWGEPLIDGWAEKLGAKCTSLRLLLSILHLGLKAKYKFTDSVCLADVRPDGVWDDFHFIDGRIVTGTNPQSARSTAKAALEVFEKL